jgi:hypothetical protein
MLPCLLEPPLGGLYPRFTDARMSAMRWIWLALALTLMTACSPLCGTTSTSSGDQHLVFTGPAAGTLTHATSTCRDYPSQQQANFHFDGALGGQTLSLNIQIHSGYKGPGTYPVGSLLDGAGEVRLQVGTLDASSATGAGNVTVDADGKSGSISVELSGGEHVAGTFKCDEVRTG